MTKAAIWRFPQLDFRTWAPRPISQSASAHLDLIRGIAALAVMWGHVRTLYFVDSKAFEYQAGSSRSSTSQRVLGTKL